MAIKKEVVKKMSNPEYHKDVLVKHWGSGKPMSHQGKQYGVHKMSYGDYFLQPYDKKHPEGRGERSKDNSGEKWFKVKDAKKGTYEVE